jgi:hypothetical protein
MGPLQLFAQCNMVVNLAVYRKCAARSEIEKGLRAMLHVNDRESLVGKYCAFACVYSAPVRPAMSNRLRHFQRARTHRLERFLELENPDEAAQRNYPATVLIIAGSLSDECSIEFALNDLIGPDMLRCPSTAKRKHFCYSSIR